MFNGYHEPSASSYNELELERGKKNQSASKWACGNGTSIQSTHLHPQNQQSDIWVSKPPFIGLPNAASPKCNCPSCFQLPESQSYQGEIPWHRSWFSRTYPVATHDLVKIPGNHHWENASLPTESYPEQVGCQFVQESGDKPLFYKPYSGLRHEIYQPGVISTVKKVTRKQDLPKQDEVVPNVGHHSRYPAHNPGYDTFRTTVDQRLIEERNNYCNQNEKFINAESCRQQGVAYGLNPSRRTILESFSKTVPSNANQNRVPSVGNRHIKDNDFHSCIDQNDIEKIGPYINHGGTDDKHCKTHPQTDVNPGQENLHAGLMNAFSSTTDYHGINLNRELPNDKDFQKFMNGRAPQYFPRNNMSDVINRNPNTVLNYNVNRKGVINIPSGSVRAAQTPPKHADIVSKSPNFGKDCIVMDKMSPKMIMNNMKIPPERFHKGNEIPRSENIPHGHISRPVADTNPPDKTYNSLSPQNMYKDYRRPQEYSYSRRNIQRPYDNPNGLLNIRSDLPVGMNQGVPNFPDLRKALDVYPRVNNPFPDGGSPQQFQKLHYQLSSDNKPQSSLFVGPQFPPKVETEKENPSRISHLEAIPYEELCKNGTSKISPLRLLRKKKLVHQKEDVAETFTPDAAANAKSSSPPLDVRRFWATWADEEEDNVPQTQMVVLDCHNIDPEQAGLLHLYNPENIRTVNLEDENLLDIKGTHFEKGIDHSPPVNGKASIYDEKVNTVSESEKSDSVTLNDVKVSLSNGNMEKTQSVPDFTLGVPINLDPVKEATPDMETKTNVIVQPNHFGRIVQNQPSDDVKQFDLFKHETKPDNAHKQKHSDAENSVLTKIQSVPVADEKNAATEESQTYSGMSKEESVSSYSSDDSQTGDLPTLPDLPTSEYRKNKFLDYSDDSFCNGGLLTEGVNKEALHRKEVEESDCEVEDKLKDFLASKPSEIGPGSFEIDDILKKLSDIKFQGIGTGSPTLSDSPDKHKTDKKFLESRKEKKTKKQSHKSSRTDQVTLQNISLTKPTIKFSIQKSHDLKISFKVLNNKKKHEKENSDEEEGEEDDAQSDEDNQEDHSNECEDGEITDRLKKNKRRLITLKLKGVSEGNDEGNVWDEDTARKVKKGLKKKKVRWEKSPLPKTPVLKIKKSRYMMAYGCESEEVPEACNGATDDASKSSESEGTAHGDFQVHETVDSAKIKLTFKRNKNGGDRKEKWSDNDEMTEVETKSNHSEDEEVTSVTDSCLKSIVDSAGDRNDRDLTTPYEYEKEEGNGESSIDSTVKEDEDINIELDQSGSGSHTCDMTADSETVELHSNAGEDMIDYFKKEDIIVEPLNIVNSCGNSPVREESNSPLRDDSENASVIEQCETSGDTGKDISEPQSDSQEVDVSAVEREVKKNVEELQNDGSENEDDSSLSELNDVTEKHEVRDDKSSEENCTENMLSCVTKEPLIDSLEIFLESKSEESAIKTEEEGEVRVSTTDCESPTTSNKEGEKNVDAGEEESGYAGNQEHEDTEPQREQYEECSQQSPAFQDESKRETPDSTEQIECQGVDVTGKSDQTEGNNADEAPITSDSPCDPDLDELVMVTVPESMDQDPAEADGDLEQLIAEVDSHVEVEDGVPEPKNIPVGEIVKEVEDITKETEDDIGAGDMEIEEDHERQEESYETEQNSKVEQPLTEETAAEDNQTKEETPGFGESEPIPEDTFEEKNNVRLHKPEIVFVRRKILRRQSYEGENREQGTNKKRVTNRSTSLNIELTITKSAEPEIAALDIDVWDIPLPPGDAPPENCLNFEKYFKSKLLHIQGKADVEDVSVLTSPQILEEISKPVSTVVKDVSEPPETEPSGLVPGESVTCDIVDESTVNEEEKELVEFVREKEGESVSGVESEQKDVQELPSSEGIRIEDLEVFGTRDTDITVEESSFRADQLYECEGLAFDEALTITDDMEEEKVSDDDKFRNIMQNCLDNAKKFLSVGNLKFLSCSEDDLLRVDDDADVKKSDSHVSKDVLLTSCEESDDLILPNSRHQSLDLSLDFVPSFCPDVNSNPCSEILPVDNWPYLEEEVASSPLRNKTEDSDLLCCLNDISAMENSSGKLKRQHRLPLHVETKRNARSIAERRRTIEGIGRWKAFRSTDEELSDAENIILNGGKKISAEFLKKSRQKYDRKLRDRTKPLSDSEGISTKRNSDYKSSSWQPRVVLFRISKNNSSLMHKKSTSAMSVQVRKPSGGNFDGNHLAHPGKTRTSVTSRKEREHRLGNENVMRPQDSEKPSSLGADGTKRKKNRFRNLHTKKRMIPQSSDQTKENKSTAYNGSNLVDSESDSDESSLSSDPPKEIVHSHNKSTKTRSSADDFPSRKLRAENDVSRTRKHEKSSERYREKRKMNVHEVEGQSKKRKPIGEVEKSKTRRDTEKSCWVCEVCGFSKSSERPTHVQSHPFHCQSCHLAFKTETNFVEHLTRKHKDIRNQHHCLLCELSFDLEKDYYRHLETREHKHLESVEKNTINTLFRLLTGQPCPVLGPVESKPEWLPSQAGTVHFYHQATPLSLALQYLKLHHDKKKLSGEASE